ncbi:WD40-repeat-containing domain protein, partial [Mycena epipterygia]
MLEGAASHGHLTWLTCVALSPTGTVVITGGKDNGVKFWNISDEQQTRTACQDNTARVTAVAFLEEDIALSASWDKSVYMHHISGGSEILIRGKISINSLAVAATTRSVVAGCHGCITIWNLSDKNVPGDPIYLTGKSQEVKSIAVHGSRIAAAVGKNIEIWGMHSKQLLKLGPLSGHTDDVTSVAFSEDGTRLVSGSMDRQVRVWDVGTG